MAGLKPTDKFLIIDESTSKTDYGTRKTIYEEGTPNEKEITAFSFKRNFLGVLGLNVESTLFAIKNLDEFEFGKSLFKIRNFYSYSKEDIELINEAISRYTLSKKQITKILEEKEDNPEFLEKLLRSIENNKKDKSMVLARKLNMRERKDMKRIKKFLKNNQWTIMAIFGALTWLLLCLEVFAGALEVIDFYVKFAHLSGL